MQTDHRREEEHAVFKLTHKENCQTWFYNSSRESEVTTQKFGFQLQRPRAQGVGETELPPEGPHLGVAGR